MKRNVRPVRIIPRKNGRNRPGRVSFSRCAAPRRDALLRNSLFQKSARPLVDFGEAGKRNRSSNASSLKFTSCRDRLVASTIAIYVNLPETRRQVWRREKRVEYDGFRRRRGRDVSRDDISGLFYKQRQIRVMNIAPPSELPESEDDRFCCPRD